MKYKVTVSACGYWRDMQEFEVESDSKEAAQEDAKEMFVLPEVRRVDVNDMDFEIEEV